MHPGRCLLSFVTISGVVNCTYGRRSSCPVMFVVTVGHAENVSDARAVSQSLERATAPASASDVWRM